MNKLVLGFLCALITTTAQADALDDLVTGLWQHTVFVHPMGCPPPSYPELKKLSLDQLQAEFAQLTSAPKHDDCLAFEQAFTIFEKLLVSGFTQNRAQAADWAVQGLQQLMLKSDFDDTVERGRDFIYLLKLQAADKEPLAEELRYMILAAAAQKVELSGEKFDSSTVEAVLAFHEGPSSVHIPYDLRFLDYAKFMQDYPQNPHNAQIAQWRRMAIDVMIERELYIARGYDTRKRFGNGVPAARARLIVAYSIPGVLDQTVPGVLDSPKILDVLAMAIQEDIKLMQAIQSLQAKPPVDLHVGSAMDDLLAAFHALYGDTAALDRDPDQAVVQLKGEIQKTRQALVSLPGNAAQLARVDAELAQAGL
jgi:hypothetical protein